MAVPTLYTIKFKGTGSPQVYPLLAGTTLGTQIGADFGTMEGYGTTGSYGLGRNNNRVAEAFGKVFAVQNGKVYAYTPGGSWALVHTFTSGFYVNTGLHLLHPDGRPLLAFLWRESATNNFHRAQSWDGVTWTNYSLGVSVLSTGGAQSVIWRNSIFWNITTRLFEFNFQTNALTTWSYEPSRAAVWCVHKNDLYLYSATSSNWPMGIHTLEGGVWVNQVNTPDQWNFSDWTNGGCLFSDGNDLIGFAPGKTNGSTQDGTVAIRWPSSGGSAVAITDPVVPATYRAGGGSASQYDTWDIVIDNNTNPGIPPTVHIWRYGGSSAMNPATTRTCWTFQYRAITFTGYVSGGPFIAGEVISGGTSLATSIAHDVAAGQVHLTEVVGTFASGELLTGQTSGATANSTSVLTEQAMISNGSSITSDFALPLCLDSVGPYIPTYPQARAELGTSGVQLTHGAVTGPGWTLNETITGVATAASITTTVDLTAGVDLSVNNLSSIQIDALGVHTDINLATGAAIPTAVTRAEIMANLSTAFGAEATVAAYDVGGQFITITSATTGSSSQIEFTAPSGTDGTDTAFGPTFGATGVYPNTFNGAQAVATLIIDNTGNIVVYLTNDTAFINGEVITGGSSGSAATLSAGPSYGIAIPSTGVSNNTKFYFQVYGTSPATVTLSLYSGSGEEPPDVLETILSVTLESGVAPGTMPSISSGTIINMPTDDGVRLWSLVHDASSFAAGDSYSLMLDAI
jgi:hypothetical protein